MHSARSAASTHSRLTAKIFLISNHANVSTAQGRVRVNALGLTAVTAAGPDTAEVAQANNQSANIQEP